VGSATHSWRASHAGFEFSSERSSVGMKGHLESGASQARAYLSRNHRSDLTRCFFTLFRTITFRALFAFSSSVTIVAHPAPSMSPSIRQLWIVQHLREHFHLTAPRFCHLDRDASMAGVPGHRFRSLLVSPVRTSFEVLAEWRRRAFGVWIAGRDLLGSHHRQLTNAT